MKVILIIDFIQKQVYQNYQQMTMKMGWMGHVACMGERRGAGAFCIPRLSTGIFYIS
jgi:hypothetical protein